MFVFVVYSEDTKYVYGFYHSENEAINYCDLFNFISEESVSWTAINLEHVLDDYL